MRSQFNYLSSDCDTPKKLKEIILAKIEKDTTTSTKTMFNWSLLGGESMSFSRSVKIAIVRF